MKKVPKIPIQILEISKNPKNPWNSKKFSSNILVPNLHMYDYKHYNQLRIINKSIYLFTFQKQTRDFLLTKISLIRKFMYYRFNVLVCGLVH